MWTLHNLLSTSISVYVMRIPGDNPTFVVNMRPNSTTCITHDSHGREIIPGATLAAYNPQDNTLYMEPYILHSSLPIIKIGDVTLDEYGNVGFSNPYNSVNGLKIYNYLPYKVNIYYKGKVVGQISANKHVYAPYIYFDNNFFSLSIGDWIGYAKCSDRIRQDDIKYTQIHSKYVKNMNIGKITGHATSQSIDYVDLASSVCKTIFSK